MAWRDHIKIHPACEMLPPMTPEQLHELSNDIRTNNLQERAKLIRDGDEYALIDGRSRLDALEIIGPIKVFDGRTPNRNFIEVIEVKDPFSYVVSANIYRRHLTLEQKRKVTADLLKIDPTKSNLALSKIVGVSDKTVASVRVALEGRSEIPNVETRADTKGRWQRVPKKKSAASRKGRKHRPRAADTAYDDTEPRLPLEQPQEAKSSAPISLVPEVEPAPSNQPVEIAPPPDPIRLDVAAVIGAVAVLDRLPDDFDFTRMTHIVDVSERPHLRGRVSRGMDALNALWDALGEAIEPTALAEQDPSLEIIDDSLEISEQMPPLPE
jgi:hypothetical protein